MMEFTYQICLLIVMACFLSGEMILGKVKISSIYYDEPRYLGKNVNTGSSFIWLQLT
ncbi:Uncharacterised protein [Acinetobacter baumannii]|nr:Uncharacterised protein [Acinetobacter baumannii]